jgi:glycosyltransferase involved in cell wall biosynthesis
MTLHDMWAFTGHCSHSFECQRWRTGCGRCPHLDTYPAVPRDATAIEWRLKQRTLGSTPMTVVSPSRWLADLASQSLLQRYPVIVIPNGLDTETYSPQPVPFARDVFGIPHDATVVMHGSANLADTAKGGGSVLEAVGMLPQAIRDRLHLLVMGDGQPTALRRANVPFTMTGYLSSDRLKALAYSCADVFVLPTLADNLPLMLQESMACGTPIIASSVGGVPELVRPGQTGYLVRPGDAKDLRDQLARLLEHSNSATAFRERCRRVAVAEYTIQKQVQRMLAIYGDAPADRTPGAQGAEA